MRKKKNKSLKKINKMLGNRYFLYVNKCNGSWILFRNRYDSLLCIRQPIGGIMSSELNTIDELYEFAKKHKTYGIGTIICVMRVLVILCYIAFLLLSMLSLDPLIEIYTLGTAHTLALVDIFIIALGLHNLSVEELELNEFTKFLDSISERN